MEGVQIVPQPEGTSIGEEVVEAKDEDKISGHDVVEPAFGPHGGDDAWEGVLAYEGVDAHAKERGEGLGIGYVGCGFIAVSDVVECDDDHESEGWKRGGIR